MRNDYKRHLHDHTLFEGYRKIQRLYGADKFISESDFSERLRLILGRIAEEFDRHYAARADGIQLGEREVSTLIYKHDLPELRRHVFDYLHVRGGVWILVDNLDKGWPASGLTPNDALILRALVDAIKRLGKDLRNRECEGFGTVFLRDDVYDSFVAGSSDRAKARRLAIDWEDPNLLREVLRLRITASLNIRDEASFQEVWGSICCSHVRGEESSQFLVDRCLMRPRALIDLVNACKSHAVNLRKARIEEDDIEEGVRQYSRDMVENVNFEIQDVSSSDDDVLYAFVETSRVLTEDDVHYHLSEHGVRENEIETLMRLLLYYGVLGIAEEDGARYIYNFGYDMKKLSAVARKRRSSRLQYAVNPAFWGGLDTRI